MARTAVRDDLEGEASEVAPFQRKTAEANPPGDLKPATTAEQPAKSDAQPAQPAVKDGDQPPAAPKKGSRRRVIFLAIAAVVIVGAGYYGYNYWTNGRFIVSTDDAYVNADMSTIAPRVAGYVTKVAVATNTPVKAGDPLVYLDDGDQKLAVQAAEDQVATQEATLTTLDRQIEAGQAAIAQAQATIHSDEAAMELAAANLTRSTALAANQFASQQTLQQAKAANDQASAAVASAKAGLTSAQANVAVLQAQRVGAQRTLDQYRTAVDQQKLLLGYYVVKAPFDGVVGNRAVDPGEYVASGQRILALVPLQAVYVDANFKETQLDGVKVGSKATLGVDAFPDEKIEGTVISVAPASGSSFSLLPTDNATGNFTKITQRVPVRIQVPADIAAKGLLRPGLSVVVDVDTRTAN